MFLHLPSQLLLLFTSIIHLVSLIVVNSRVLIMSPIRVSSLLFFCPYISYSCFFVFSSLSFLCLLFMFLVLPLASLCSDFSYASWNLTFSSFPHSSSFPRSSTSLVRLPFLLRLVFTRLLRSVSRAYLFFLDSLGPFSILFLSSYLLPPASLFFSGIHPSCSPETPVETQFHLKRRFKHGIKASVDEAAAPSSPRRCPY